jgi:hypothetical protein
MVCMRDMRWTSALLLVSGIALFGACGSDGGGTTVASYQDGITTLTVETLLEFGSTP